MVLVEQLKDAAGAKEQLQKAIELAATEPEIRFELAKALRTLGETQAAQEQLAIYQKSLRKNRTGHWRRRSRRRLPRLLRLETTRRLLSRIARPAPPYRTMPDSRTSSPSS